MKAEKIILKNFQSHEYSEFNFASGVNVLAGDSASGKTAFWRAVDFLLYGGKWDDSFLRKKCDHCEIEIIFDNKVSVKREKGKKLNKYIITYSDGKVEEYENFGSNVPIPVQKILNTSELFYDKDKSLKLNVIGQFDPVFLFTESGSTRAKVLGLLGKFHLIDMCLRELNKDINKENNDNKFYKSQLEGLEKDEKNYENLSLQEKCIEEASLKLGELNVLENKQKSLEDLQFLVSSVEKEEKEVQSILQKVNLVNVNEIGPLLQRYDILCNLYLEIENVNNEFYRIEHVYKSVKEEFEKNLNSYKEDILRLGVCPLCGNKVEKEKIESHLFEQL